LFLFWFTLLIYRVVIESQSKELETIFTWGISKTRQTKKKKNKKKNKKKQKNKIFSCPTMYCNLTSRQACKVRWGLGLGPDTDCPQSSFPHSASYRGTIVHYIIGTSIGTFTFLAFGTSATIYHFWFFAAQLVYKRDWANLHRLFTDKKTLSRQKQKSRDKKMEKLDSKSQISQKSNSSLNESGES
jgi:hypothetical protein